VQYSAALKRMLSSPVLKSFWLITNRSMGKVLHHLAEVEVQPHPLEVVNIGHCKQAVQLLSR
jgi:hypothetical protein